MPLRALCISSVYKLDPFQAAPLLENAFRLLNKLYTDRHPFVIIALCRLVACCAADTTEIRVGGRAEKFAELALRRFEAVSDTDLLQFYVPLLQLCVHLWEFRIIAHAHVGRMLFVVLCCS